MSEEKSDEFTVAVGPDKASMTARGESASRLTNSFVDLLSFFTDGAGALGDMVRAYRIENAIRAMARARKLAEDNHLNLKPVPPKFLIQWTEAASLEEPGDHDLSESWAHLLVNAGMGLKPTHILFKRLLSEMSGRHVELVKWLCDFDDVRGNFDFSEMSNNAANWNKFFSDLSEIREFSEFDSEEFRECIESVNSSGIKVIAFRFGESGQPLWYLKNAKELWLGHNKAKPFEDDHSFEYLKLAGLIEDISGEFRAYMVSGEEKKRYVVQVRAWHLTKLGLAFLKTCNSVVAEGGN